MQQIIVSYFRDTPPQKRPWELPLPGAQIELQQEFSSAHEWMQEPDWREKPVQQPAAEPLPGYYTIALVLSCKTVELIGVVHDTGANRRLNARDIYDAYNYALVTLGEECISGIDSMARARLSAIARNRAFNPNYTL